MCVGCEVHVIGASNYLDSNVDDGSDDAKLINFDAA